MGMRGINKSDADVLASAAPVLTDVHMVDEELEPTVDMPVGFGDRVRCNKCHAVWVWGVDEGCEC